MPGLDSFILRDMGSIARYIHTSSDVSFKKLRLQKGQFIFLTRVCEQPGLNQIDLSTLLKVDKTTTAKALQKLIMAGYIYKVKDDYDQRMWRLFPTQKAAEIYPVIIAEENKNIMICLQDFSQQERVQIEQLLTKMRLNIEESWKKLKS